MQIEEFLKQNSTIAIIGASNNPSKYGFRIYNNLKNKGFEIYPVNNHEEKILNDNAYKSVSELPKKVDILDFVVPPAISLEIVKEAISLGYKIFWFQPGSDDDNVRKFFENQKELTAIFDECIMTETSRLFGDPE